jgi:hypothetical protein
MCMYMRVCGNISEAYAKVLVTIKVFNGYRALKVDLEKIGGS